MDNSLPIWECIEGLSNNLLTLKQKDKEFAESLLHSAKTRGLSPKQEYWVRVLHERVERPPMGPERIGDFTPIFDLLVPAGTKLNSPKIKIYQDGHPPIQATLAGPGTSRPGTLNIRSTYKGSGGYVWYGRLTPEGVFEPSTRVPRETIKEVMSALLAIAENPAKAIFNSGGITGNCCFCHHTLTDDRSKKAGYGPDCAKNYGLPY